jgi:hypothetical protein
VICDSVLPKAEDINEPGSARDGTGARSVALGGVESGEPPDNQARAVWSFVAGLALSEFYARIRARDDAAGRPASDPAVLLSNWVTSPCGGTTTLQWPSLRARYPAVAREKVTIQQRNRANGDFEQIVWRPHVPLSWPPLGAPKSPVVSSEPQRAPSAPSFRTSSRRSWRGRQQQSPGAPARATLH